MKRRVQTAAPSLRGVIMSSPYIPVHESFCCNFFYSFVRLFLSKQKQKMKHENLNS